MEGEFFGTAVDLLYMMHHTWGMPGIVDVLIETIESMKSLFVWDTDEVICGQINLRQEL